MAEIVLTDVIKRFGPLVFATIQTVRQFLSVVLSILFFNHFATCLMYGIEAWSIIGTSNAPIFLIDWYSGIDENSTAAMYIVPFNACSIIASLSG